ncbi:hypothetical protein [Pseudomonas sp. R5(2019)]|uniref:hypothetical protein n=1 Tax=Pseudomonas sp. R5(2019) TaxID=2697566 RepID=UPI001412463A|nr:hypothetical protein [Pseudomonas sp. R5(2019)]NBA95145.1 hypothetical protein [Pseudomonas sp. R5(2019)]
MTALLRRWYLLRASHSRTGLESLAPESNIYPADAPAPTQQTLDDAVKAAGHKGCGKYQFR